MLRDKDIKNLSELKTTFASEQKRHFAIWKSPCFPPFSKGERKSRRDCHYVAPYVAEGRMRGYFAKQNMKSHRDGH